MDSTNQPVNTAQNSNPTQQNVSLTDAPVITPAIEPAGQGYKEQEPVISPASSEYIVPSEKKPEISPEVAKAGVESISELPKITPEHEKIGIVRAKENVLPSGSGTVQLPMSTMQIQQAIKENKDTSNSKSWLLRIWDKVLKRIS